MADEDENSDEIVNIANVKMEEVFLDGENDVPVNVQNGEEGEFLEEDDEDEDEYGVFRSSSDTNLPDQVIPRRSSMMNKDRSRRPARKKTVSFSSMPAEKKIATVTESVPLLSEHFHYSIIVPRDKDYKQNSGRTGTMPSALELEDKISTAINRMASWQSESLHGMKRSVYRRGDLDLARWMNGPGECHRRPYPGTLKSRCSIMQIGAETKSSPRPIVSQSSTQL
ncbi:hypothetical protein RRG08_061240 [Elysia crispata]|uniref:Uncharacterized protein n=1 Tax=Elysia crispata TaxID=231223 RepID=A0AAE1DFL3_9GAST|nr:hypothetical protein RRG08_061240 [Elysia crispata]